MKILLTFLFGLTILIGQAQETAKSRVSNLPFFIDLDAGLLIALVQSADTYTHYSIGAGYRFNNKHAIGGEYRNTSYSTRYYGDYGTGAGLSYRLTFKGVFLKLSAGKQLTGRKEAYEEKYKYDYDRGGFYQNLSLGYHFRSGLLIGFTSTVFGNTRYMKSDYEFSDDYTGDDRDFFWDVRDLPTEAGMFLPAENFKNTFWAGTITLGYSFPGRYWRE